jgi:hypothetical protein
MGLGAALLAYVTFRSIKGAYAETKRSKTTRGTKMPSLSSLDYEQMSNRKAKIPALVSTFNEETGGFDYSKLNFTPRRMSETHDGTQYQDAQILRDPLNIPSEFQKIKTPSQMMHPNDYQILQHAGIIPEGFPLSQTQYAVSPNGLNEYIIGYSAPFKIPTNRDALEVIKPLWAVSFGHDFIANAKPPKDFPDSKLFRNLSERVLAAEWLLTNKGEYGCHRGQALTACNAERAGLLNAIIQRTKRKQERIKSDLDYKSVVYGPGQKWNGKDKFMSAYRGYFGETGHASSPLKDLSQEAQNNFTVFYDHAFWQLPPYTYKADSFIHPYSMSKDVKLNPSWTKEFNPMKDDASSYAATHAILVGKAIFTDQRRYFK